MTVEWTAQTAVRIVDVAVTATFSPAAVAVIDPADLYARSPFRIGFGPGGGATAFSDQGTDGDVDTNRSEAISTALLFAFLVGIPFLISGPTLDGVVIDAFLTSERVVALGMTYLTVTSATSSMRSVSLVGSRSLQGVGNTRVPILVNVSANVVNAGLSIGFGFGPVGLPVLGALGVGPATSTANVPLVELLPTALARLVSPTSPAHLHDRTVAG